MEANPAIQCFCLREICEFVYQGANLIFNHMLSVASESISQSQQESARLEVQYLLSPNKQISEVQAKIDTTTQPLIMTNMKASLSQSAEQDHLPNLTHAATTYYLHACRLIIVSIHWYSVFI
ncbi:Hypothetical_protein [Hexamita inflata]|uniref:Hypothetical_protein n=1 Tax=Hexamita inflata TaxID=28002 RepID=A0AA86NIN0_9EUKA|nr:Hypothetical protein HINF_LOCUS7384 [Hexamita inflata]